MNDLGRYFHSLYNLFSTPSDQKESKLIYLVPSYTSSLTLFFGWREYTIVSFAYGVQPSHRNQEERYSHNNEVPVMYALEVHVVHLPLHSMENSKVHCTWEDMLFMDAK
jgi:hypothetical protein